MKGVARASLLAVAFVALNVIAVELAVRAFYATQVGPRILLYGTSWQRNQTTVAKAATDTGPKTKRKKEAFADSPQAHANNFGGYEGYSAGEQGYSKYFPHEEKWIFSADRKKRYPVRINNHGFRGADFEVEKAPGTIRVLTLGASSTFGYHDADDETYPYYLQQLLNAGARPGVHYEVINFAIPHATTDNILAMMFNEGFALDPDVVTFYEGANDAATIEARSGRTAEGWREWFAQHFLLAAVVDRILPANAVADPEWWWSDELAARRSKAFLANLSRLAEECRRRGIGLVVATQQMRSEVVPQSKIRGVTYDAEVALVREKLARGEIGPRVAEVAQHMLDARLAGSADGHAVRAVNMFTWPRIMLIHSRLMADERTWAAQRDVPLVDVVELLDPRRDLLLSWVHLHPEANLEVARALAPVVRREAEEHAGKTASGA